MSTGRRYKAKGETRGIFMVGDIITLTGPSVPLDLRTKYFIVLAVDDGRPTLSPPYLDADCTERYHPVDPRAKVRARNEP